MLGSLVALDLALFYVFWEVMLVPMYFIIGIWGGPRRIYASMKFFLFTMAGSLLMFLAILYIAIRHQAATGVWSFALEDLYRLRLHGPRRDAALPGLRPRVRDQGPGLPAAHVAARRAHRGAHGRLDHPGRRPAEARRVRVPALRPAPLPRRGHALRARGSGSSASSGSSTAPLVAYAQHDMKRLVAYSSVSHLGLVVIGVGAFTTMSLHRLDRPDDQPRPLDRSALPARRRPLRAPPHPRARRLRRHRRRRPRHDHALPDRDALLDRPAGPERLRRRVPHPARHVDVAPPLVGRRRRRAASSCRPSTC